MKQCQPDEAVETREQSQSSDLFPTPSTPFSPASFITSGHCDFKSLKQSLSGQAVPILRERLAETGAACDSSTAIWLSTAVRHSHSGESPPPLLLGLLGKKSQEEKKDYLITDFDSPLNRVICVFFWMFFSYTLECKEGSMRELRDLRAAFCSL